MLIPKKNRTEVYKYLFREGVTCAEKDFNLPKHPEIDVPNLQVIKLMQSFKSKGYVTERFAWRHYYWFLTDEGIAFLREYLALPAEIVPATLKKTNRPLERPNAGGERGERRGPRPEGGDRRGPRPEGRGEYRAAADKAGAPADYKPEFK